MSFTSRTAQHMMTIKAARTLKKEIEKAGIDNLKILMQNGVSIVGTYLDGCSAQKKAEIKRDLDSLMSMGITCDMMIDEVSRQIPDLASVIQANESYRKSELHRLEQFLLTTK